MDKKEANNILTKEMEQCKRQGFQGLSDRIGELIILERTGSDGTIYQIEIENFWDHPGKPGENLRVIGSIDDGTFLAAFSPLTLDFIMRPDGTFIGE